MAITHFFWQLDGGKAVSVPLRGAMALPAGAKHGSDTRPPVLLPVKPLDYTIAALIVPDGYPKRVACNGVLLDAGVHPLLHSAHLDIGGESFWVSAESLPEDDQYDPDRHGAGGRCGVSRRPLQVDDPITICPGTSATACTAIYKRAIWQKATADGKRFRCPYCKYETGAATWRPNLPRRSDRLRRLLDLIGQQESKP